MGNPQINKNHKLMFSADDEREAGSALRLAVINQLRQRGITYADFSQRYIDCYAKRGFNRNSIINNRNNLIATLLGKAQISWGRFIEVFRDVLRLNLVKITLTIMDEKGKTEDIVIDVKSF